MKDSYKPLTSGPSPRIARIAEASRKRGDPQPHDPFIKDLAKGFELYSGASIRERQAQTWAYALERLPVYILPECRLVGMRYHLGEKLHVPHPMEWNLSAERLSSDALPHDSELVEIGAYSKGSIPGHVAWRWDWILEKGVTGLLDDVVARESVAADMSSRQFYHNVVTVLKALLEWNNRHVSSMEAKLAAQGREAGGKTVADGAGLVDLIDLSRRVPAYPATTFREAVQSFYLQYLAVMSENPYGGNSPGRLDYYLWPYLEKDLKWGRCTLQDARELIDELLIYLDERIHDADGWVEAIVVGGCHPDGSPAINPLTFILVESIIGLRQTHPSVYIRLPDDAPDELTQLASYYIKHGRNRAQIFSDRAIMAAMQSYGMPAMDASMYCCGGCMEISPHGKNSDLLFAAKHNIPKTLELVLTGGRCLKTGRRLRWENLRPFTAYDNFGELYEAFISELRRELTTVFARLDIHSATMAARRPVYLLSSMVEDCLDRGRELHDGGARYHDYGTTPLGIANASDALYAVKRAVFEDRLCTAQELLVALEANFEGHKDLRAKLLATAKYGQGDPGADGMARRVLEDICSIYSEYRTRWGGRVKPIIFTFLWAPEMGAILGGSADGRLAGTPIAQGITPQRLGMSRGITTAIASVGNVGLEKVSGGASTMWDLDSNWANEETITAILKTFQDMGGQIFQGNTTDVGELKAAFKDPESHPELLVRVGGFSAVFVNLDRNVQREIIERHRHRA